jgi:S1-C subfamily serine protease
LKLKDPHGAEIIRIDQDAPAAKSGLKIHDVVVQMNGQRIEGMEQFRRMLRETPPGRTISLVAMRDGQTLNISVQLADRSEIATHIIGGLESDPPLVLDDEESATVLPPPSPLGRSRGSSSSFLGTFMRSRYYVGVDLQPLPTGLADYFGVRGGSGLLVGNVFPNSPAAAAGLKAADVIQKVNGQPIVSLSDWERAIRVNHGKQVQVTVIRDKKEQTLTMLAGSAKTTSDLVMPEIKVPDAQALARLAGDLASIDAATLVDPFGNLM